MSLEESNKMSKKTPSQDSNSEEVNITGSGIPKWELDDMIEAYKESCCENWEDFAGGEKIYF